MATKDSHTVNGTFPLACPRTEHESHGREGGTTTASRARDGGDHGIKTAVSTLEMTEFGGREPRVRSADLGLVIMGGSYAHGGAGGRGSGHGRKRCNGDNDDGDGENNEDCHATNIANPNDSGTDGKRRKSYRASRCFPQEMRYRASGLPTGRWLNKHQGRSTSIESNLAPVTSKYGMFTVEQELEEGDPAGAATPLARWRPCKPGVTRDHNYFSFRLPGDSPSLSKRQERDIERIGSQDVTLIARQTEARLLQKLSTKSDQTPYRGSGGAAASIASSSGVIGQFDSTESQPAKASDGWGTRKPLNWILRAFKSSEEPSQSTLPFTEPGRGVEQLTYARLSGTDAPDVNPAPLPPNEKNPHLDQDSTPNDPTRYLYLCVHTRGTARFTEINCTGLINDHDFFDELKSSYDSTRGRLRRFLSIRQYHHCEFYLFGKWGVDMGGPLAKTLIPCARRPLIRLHAPTTVRQSPLRSHYTTGVLRSLLPL